MTTSPHPEGTRLDLIEAGILLFGQKGFSATSVRELAALAGANIAAIAYHFGGKEELRLACAEEFGRQMRDATDKAPVSPAPTASKARDELAAIIQAVLAFLLGARGPGGRLARGVLPGMAGRSGQVSSPNLAS